MPTKTPVIYVPGSTGTVLRDRATQKIVWGRGKQLVVPRDNGYAMARPLSFSPFSSESRLEVVEAIDEIVLAGVFRKDVYGPIAEALAANGYQLGDLDKPRADDTAFLFAYDWRLDHRIGAERLVERLEALRAARREERLEVDLICQSNGGYICRYLAKYGGASLEDAEAGVARRPSNLAIRKMIMMGNSNGGSLRILREIHRGRDYIAIVGRKFRPEVMFTLPALFQDLPVVREDLFLDGEGNPLEVDIFDAETWRRYGWSIFADAAKRRTATATDVFADEERQMEYLRQILDNAKRFHNVLARDVPDFGSPRYYFLQSKARDTPDRAVLMPHKGGWEILFTGDKKLQRNSALHAQASAEGDGHGTLASQGWLSPQEKAASVAETFYSPEGHFELILVSETHRRMLDFLADEN